MGLKKANSHLGDLARAVGLDNYHPRRNSLAAWVSYLEAMDADLRVVQNLNEVWHLYEAEESPPKTEEEYHLNLKDEQWLLQRPALPSYWTRTPEVIRVGCNEKAKLPQDDQFATEFGIFVHSVFSHNFCKAVEKLARYFQREFGYDFLAYTVGENIREGDSRIQPYLFFSPEDHNQIVARPIGACGFMLMGGHDQWVMNWAWMHPFARRKGHLTKAWPLFTRRYGEFKVMTPLSESMGAFLKKVQYRYLCSKASNMYCPTHANAAGAKRRAAG